MSSLGILYVGTMGNARHKDPMTIMKQGYIVTAVCISSNRFDSV